MPNKNSAQKFYVWDRSAPTPAIPQSQKYIHRQTAGSGGKYFDFRICLMIYMNKFYMDLVFIDSIVISLLNTIDKFPEINYFCNIYNKNIQIGLTFKI